MTRPVPTRCLRVARDPEGVVRAVELKAARAVCWLYRSDLPLPPEGAVPWQPPARWIRRVASGYAPPVEAIAWNNHEADELGDRANPVVAILPTLTSGPFVRYDWHHAGRFSKWHGCDRRRLPGSGGGGVASARNLREQVAAHTVDFGFLESELSPIPRGCAIPATPPGHKKPGRVDFTWTRRPRLVSSIRQPGAGPSR